LKLTLLKSSFLLILEKFARLALGFLTSIFVVRYLGPANFGELSYIQAFYTVVSFLGILGTTEILSRELSLGNRNKSEFISAVLFVRIAGTLIASLLTVGVSLQQGWQGYQNILVLTLLLTMLINISDINQTILFVERQASWISISRFIGSIFSNILKIFLVFSGAPLAFFLVPLLLDSIVIGSVTFVLLNRLDYRVRLKFPSLVTLLFLLKKSLPLGASMFLISLHLRIDQLMLKEFITLSDLGQYSVAIRLIEIFYIIPTAVAANLLPYLVQLNRDDPVQFREAIKNYLFYCIWAGIVVAVVLFFSSNMIIFSIYGLEFSDSAVYLRYLGICFLFVAVGTIGGIWQTVEDKQKYRFYIQLFGLFTNVLLNVILIRNLGALGAALATIITLFLVTFVYPVIFKDLRSFVSLMISSIFFFPR